MIDCKDREKRFSLIEFIPMTGKAALPACDFCLKQNPPWYVIRNLIIIISRIEDPNLYKMVRPYLTHKDIRVQLQILHCINTLGGARMRNRLIEALTCINDELKQQVVVQLGNMGGKDVGNALCTLLEKRGEFAIHVRDELVLAICTKIKFAPSDRAIKIVKELLTERIERFNEGDRIFQAAQDALVSMELKNTGNTTLSTFPSATSAAFGSDAFRVPVVTEEEFDSLIEESVPAVQEDPAPPPTPSTVSRESERQPAAEKPKPFGKEDIIREAKKNPSDPGSAVHFTLWTKFYEKMTTEEFTAFHAALSLETYEPNELIIAYGDLQAPLFFFDSGTVDLVRIQGGEEVHLSPIGAGELIGSDIFLTGETWNLSLYARETVSARVFDLEHLLKMQFDFQHLAEKIFSFCSGHDVLQPLLRVLDTPDTPGIKNVSIQRKSASGKSSADNLQQGMILKKMKGGLCFTFPAKATEKINMLLEKQLTLSVRLSTGTVDLLPARIVGTRRSFASPAEAVIFVRFFQPLTDARYSCEKIELPESV
ncbi:MAG: hypothetical protein VR65_15810 [Desulfobulbaceae bacterium BRH_c16a]|nr:MAG: hypothetical protein VR65_15810 [Desulfobulbaceae bacterium BRH_c16a]